MQNIIMRDIHRTYADRLRDARENAGLTQQEAAALLGLSQGNVSNLERGEVAPPSLVRAADFANVYQTSVDFLLGRTDDMRPVTVIVQNAQVVHQRRTAQDYRDRINVLMGDLPKERLSELEQMAFALREAENESQQRTTEMMLALVDSLSNEDDKVALGKARRLFLAGDVRAAFRLIWEHFGQGQSKQPPDEIA